MRILLLASHAIAEYDDVRMFSDLGLDVFAPGGFEDPAAPGEGMRPPLPQAPRHPELAAMCHIQRVAMEQLHGPAGDRIDWAKARLHPELIEWADAIVVHHFPEPWIAGQWEQIRHKRVIWRTCGQSNPWLEQLMARYRAQGLEIVRYSPAERRHFAAVGSFAGEDAVIRFGKYPADYGPWIGDDAVVGNVTQNMVDRGAAVGLDFWLEATRGLPAKPAGPGSEQLPGGVGPLTYDAMREYLRRIRTYLFTGTKPASYTLGLIEAMLSGVPVVSIGPAHYPEGLFEGHEITGHGKDDPGLARQWLKAYIEGADGAADHGAWCRRRAIELFGVATVGRQWLEFLGVITDGAALERRLAGAAA